jgi:hypothetical protein
VEKIAENILEDLSTRVLDWNLADVNLQVGRADIILSELGIKRLVRLEVKRPGTLAWHRQAVEKALDLARGYAASQKVGAVAVSDGNMLYAADIVHGGLRDRIFVSLDRSDPPLDLWWISVHGIYRPCEAPTTSILASAPPPADPVSMVGEVDAELLQPKYHLPARCFAYVGRADSPGTWKLPYLVADGMPDLKRLPKAIQSILSNYRGVKVSIPREWPMSWSGWAWRYRAWGRCRASRVRQRMRTSKHTRHWFNLTVSLTSVAARNPDHYLETSRMPPVTPTPGRPGGTTEPDTASTAIRRRHWRGW